MPVQVLVEWRGVDQPALIWRAKRAREQWLSQDQIDQMGTSRFTAYWAEFAGSCWHLGDKCDDAKDALIKQPRIGRPIVQRGLNSLRPRSTFYTR